MFLRKGNNNLIFRQLQHDPFAEDAFHLIRLMFFFFFRKKNEQHRARDRPREKDSNEK